MRLTVLALSFDRSVGSAARISGHGNDRESSVKEGMGSRFGRSGRVKIESRSDGTTAELASGGFNSWASVATSGGSDGCFLSSGD